MEKEKAPKIVIERRVDCIQLDAADKTYFTDEGYLVDHPILTSCGIFKYTKPDGTIRRELRLPEHVFSKESLESYKGKPIIITHNAGKVSKDNVDRVQIGTILSEGYRDGDDVRAEIIIHDTDDMKNCGLRELSLGYNLKLIEEPGTWNGQHYDAIQTDIVINHLALVPKARAGGQARLNIDGADDVSELKGGKEQMGKVTKTSHADGGAMSPDELQKAIEAYKARKADRVAAGNGDGDPVPDVNAVPTPEEPAKKTDGEGTEEEGKSPADIVEMVKANRDRRDAMDDPEDINGAMGVIAQQDSDIDALLACLAKFLEEEKSEGNHDGEGCEGEEGEEPKEDGADDNSQSMNADGMDSIVRQRLSICRIGDKLNMDGLENMSISDGKKAVIKKIYPEMRLDGQSDAYINVLYDLAVNETKKRKDVSYQRRQMAGSAPAMRTDGVDNKSMASSARQRMIEREGGNE